MTKKTTTTQDVSHDTSIQLSIRSIADFVVHTYDHCYAKNLPLHPIEWIGEPGIGKTALARDAYGRLKQIYPDLQLLVFAPSTTPEDELGGIPIISPQGLDYSLPLHYANLLKLEAQALVVLDDARQCSAGQQKILANMIYERNLRGREFGRGVQFLLTGNRLTDGAGVVKELTHYSQRKVTLQATFSVTEWTYDWAIPNNIREEVIAFVNWQRGLFSEFKSNREKNPSPRTWAKISHWMEVLDTMRGVTSAIRLGIYSGEVGAGAAHEFLAFCTLYGKIPQLTEVVAAPATYEVPDDLGLQYATCLAFSSQATVHNFKALLVYVGRMSTEHAALFLQAASTRQRELLETEAGRNWLLANKSVLVGYRK